MTPTVNDDTVERALLANISLREMFDRVHFAHPPGKYLRVRSEGSTVPSTYMVLYHHAAPIGHVRVTDLYNTEAAPASELEYGPFALPENQFENPFSQLDEVITAIRESRSMDTSAEHSALLARAIQLQGAAPTDIDAWAQQLASDVSTLPD